MFIGYIYFVYTHVYHYNINCKPRNIIKGSQHLFGGNVHAQKYISLETGNRTFFVFRGKDLPRIIFNNGIIVMVKFEYDCRKEQSNKKKAHRMPSTMLYVLLTQSTRKKKTL